MIKPYKSLFIKYCDNDLDLEDFEILKFKMLCEIIQKFELENVIIETDHRIELKEEYFQMFEDLNLKSGQLQTKLIDKIFLKNNPNIKKFNNLTQKKAARCN